MILNSQDYREYLVSFAIDWLKINNDGVARAIGYLEFWDPLSNVVFVYF